MKKVLTALAAGVPLIAAAVWLPPAASAAETRGAGATTSTTACTAPSPRAPDGTRIESVTAVRQAGGTVKGTGLLGGEVSGVPAFCQVTVVLTHPGEGDHATVRTWLPEQRWNGRFQAIGGSAYRAGDNGVGLGGAVKAGYAVTTTDAGVGDVLDTSWVLDHEGEVDRTALKNFASRSQHEAAAVGKAVVSGVYGKPAAYSYFTGCSTGGRQGYMEAQAHPGDYDGILADAPAINWDEFEVATLWPQVVLENEKTHPSDCELTAFTDAAVTACDQLDGVRDGLVDDASRCDFDPRRLIGTKVDCEGEELTVTAADAAVVRKIWDGPRTTSGRKLWAGVPVGADLAGLAHSAPAEPGGPLAGQPFPVPARWVQLFLKKDPSFDLTRIGYDEFTTLFRQSQAEYDKVIGTDDPDLSDFRRSGGKLLTWQGDADEFIPAQGTVRYHQQVARELGGARRVDDFYRLFLAPGTGHCGLDGQDGSTDGLAALTRWVEHGTAPATLPATLVNADGEQVGRDLCAYPKVSRYQGHGDPSRPAGFRCVAPARH
ncbi:tannase/feruloyl esterase family alpha/beta hydrolase [Streptomyces sp. NPDC006552]|uniref:tannase/feruloyl esterase family alpha/beta hydrolase n=1 Tax=Streptomyces sp. NPDC006552 TaxID=3157179 RepID=UPI0033A5D160